MRGGGLLGLTLVLTLNLFSLNLTSPTLATTQSSSTDISLTIDSIIALSVTNCNTTTDPDSSRLNIHISPNASTDTYGANCQTLSITTNTPGYSLTTKAVSNDNTNNLTYQNPTTVSPLPFIPALPITNTPTPNTGTPANPTTLTSNSWGFAVENKLGFDTTYTTDPNSTSPSIATNKFANLPITDITIADTNTMPTVQEDYTFYYATRVSSTKPAGTYSTTITYAVVGKIPEPPKISCGGLVEVICYTIDLPSGGSHNIGTGGIVSWIDHAYDWDIFIDNQPITDCGGGNNCTGMGGSTPIKVTGLTAGKHQIRIVPHGAPAPGWGNAFASDWGGDSAQIVTIDAPLTTMAFAPKPSESTTSAAAMFGQVFAGCANLTTPMKIIDTYKLPSTVTDLSEFLRYAHVENGNLESSIDLSGLAGWFNANNSITDLSGFLLNTHSENTNNTSPIDLSPLASWFNNNNSITNLRLFLAGTHDENISLKNTINLSPLASWFNNNNSITNLQSFLHATYLGNTSITAPVDLSPLANWFNANNSVTNLGLFLSNTHSGNTRLTQPINLTPLTGWFIMNNSVTNLSTFLNTTHGANQQLTTPIVLPSWSFISVTDLSAFLNGTHINNTQLTDPIDLSPLSGWFSANRSFTALSSLLQQTHSDNTNLNLTGQTILPNWIKTAKLNTTDIWQTTMSFHRTFYVSSTIAGDTGEIKFMDGTVLSSIGTPTTNKQTYTNRTGITPVNSNWK